MEELTCEAILEAIATFDKLGSDEFFRHFGIERSRGRSYFIRRKGREYDMKAVVRVAHGLLINQANPPLPPLNHYSDSVARWLRNHDFEVVRHEVTCARTSQEGRSYWDRQKRAERDPRLAREAKELNAARNGGWIKCEACGFRDREPSMFDAHHKKPLAATGARETRVKDFAVLCPTCHRWAHAKAGDRLHPLPVKQVRRGRRLACRSKRH